ncbi:MAG TPA: hypothetical protein DC084_24505 [Cupriavidus sp.]|nr:hypothetical protein [Cupriavidus sp.]HBO83129.1 hypothetical protein [Cupriavidus sp.]
MRPPSSPPAWSAEDRSRSAHSRPSCRHHRQS